MQLVGGVILIIAASAVGVVQNQFRDRPLKLIQNTKAVSTVQHGETRPEPASAIEQKGASGEETSAEPPLPEGAVSTEQVRALFDQENAYIIDARDPAAFAEGHIPGSINIPYDRLPDYLETLELEVPMDGQVVCYCWSPTCDFSDQLATELKILGYENIRVYTGGWEHWTEAGLPTEGTGASE